MVTKTMVVAAAVDMDKTEDKRFNLLNLSLFFLYNIHSHFKKKNIYTNFQFYIIYYLIRNTYILHKRTHRKIYFFNLYAQNILLNCVKKKKKFN